MAVPAWRSTEREGTPWYPSSIAVVRPIRLPPTMRTGTSSSAMSPRYLLALERGEVERRRFSDQLFERTHCDRPPPRSLPESSPRQVRRLQQFRCRSQLARGSGEADPPAVHDEHALGEAECDGGELLDQQYAHARLRNRADGGNEPLHDQRCEAE